MGVIKREMYVHVVDRHVFADTNKDGGMSVVDAPVEILRAMMMPESTGAYFEPGYEKSEVQRWDYDNLFAYLRTTPMTTEGRLYPQAFWKRCFRCGRTEDHECEVQCWMCDSTEHDEFMCPQHDTVFVYVLKAANVYMVGITKNFQDPIPFEADECVYTDVYHVDDAKFIVLKKIAELMFEHGLDAAKGAHIPEYLSPLEKMQIAKFVAFMTRKPYVEVLERNSLV